MSKRDVLKTAWDRKLYQVCKQDGYKIGKLYLRQLFCPQNRSDLIKIRLTSIYGNSHPPHFETGLSWNYVDRAVLELIDAAST